MITCPICKSSFDDLPTKHAKCQFLAIAGVNQNLIRHQCSICDTIFGSQEMLNLSSEKLSKAYQNIYNSGHREGDTTDMELFLFENLQPQTNGTYLNWGAGTNRTSNEIAKKGYRLLSYDPGIPPSVPGYITIDYAKTLKFDGIISNNVLDHMQDPIGSMLFMKSLLKSDGVMIHASDGFQYVIDYTKFHLYFFVGRSVQTISNAIDMQHIELPSPVVGATIIQWSFPK